MTNSSDRLLLDSMEAIKEDLGEIRTDVAIIADRSDAMKASIDKLQEAVLIGNGKPSLMSRVNNLEKINEEHKELRKQITSSVVKTLVPIVLVALGAATVLITGFGKWTQGVDTQAVVQSIKQELKDEQKNMVYPSSSSGASDGVRNNTK